MKINSKLAVLGLAAALLAGQAYANDAAKEGMHHGPHGKRGHGFEEADTNKDGNVTKDEFRAQGDKIFDKLDTNHDGKISKDERDARRKEFEAKRAEWKAKRDAEAKTGKAE